MSELNYKELQEQGVFDVPYRAFEFMRTQQTKIDQLNAELALCREENKGLVGKVSVEKKRVEVALQVIFDCRAIGADRIYTCDAVEKTLRGEHENN